jgi:hypothetical protein
MEFSTFNSIDIIDIVLYKYNYYDNRLWTGAKNQLRYIEINPQSILVSPDDVKKHLEVTYPNELNKFKAIGSEFLHKEANSIYFMNRFLYQMPKMKWIKLTLDKSKNYSRVIGNESQTSKSINFSYKVLHATVRLYDIFSEEELLALNKILLELGLLEPHIPYMRHSLNEIVDKLDNWLNSADADNEIDVVAILLDMIDPKMQGDNPEILLVTDY